MLTEHNAMKVLSVIKQNFECPDTFVDQALLCFEQQGIVGDAHSYIKFITTEYKKMVDTASVGNILPVIRKSILE